MTISLSTTGLLAALGCGAVILFVVGALILSSGFAAAITAAGKEKAGDG